VIVRLLGVVLSWGVAPVFVGLSDVVFVALRGVEWCVAVLSVGWLCCFGWDVVMVGLSVRQGVAIGATVFGWLM